MDANDLDAVVIRGVVSGLVGLVSLRLVGAFCCDVVSPCALLPVHCDVTPAPSKDTAQVTDHST